jgi:DNA sulfur modification protein DndB
MGNWTYFTVRMTARELDESVRFAYDVYDDRTLGEAIQRVLKAGRNKEIVNYLKKQSDHFFSSLVVAALDGDPKFYPVDITEDPQFAILKDDSRLSNAFGVLKFDGTQKYYALDGQHRLKAIKTLLDRDDELSEGCPVGFEEEQFSVLIVVPEDPSEVFIKKYRRLFANLNRYAKPMDMVTNIMIDEDDAFAILTRRLISDHSFFQWPGRQKDSAKVKIIDAKGNSSKNLKSGDVYFTSLETLYKSNITLLYTEERKNQWAELKEFIKVRPPDALLEELYTELAMYWDVILEAIPELRNEPQKMRVHALTEDDRRNGLMDHLLFWPIGLEFLAELVRDQLKGLSPGAVPSREGMLPLVAPLGRINWELHHSPWRHLLLVRDAGGENWKIRNEERKAALRIAKRVMYWVLGLELDRSELQQLERDWSQALVPPPEEAERKRLWADIAEMRQSVCG